MGMQNMMMHASIVLVGIAVDETFVTWLQFLYVCESGSCLWR
jgi:hypothetical protein